MTVEELLEKLAEEPLNAVVTCDSLFGPDDNLRRVIYDEQERTVVLTTETEPGKPMEPGTGAYQCQSESVSAHFQARLHDAGIVFSWKIGNVIEVPATNGIVK